METVLWILQALLAAVFLATGLVKLTQPRQKMAEGQMRWAAQVTDGQFRALGLAEVLGAIGLIVPGVLGVEPVLVPLAAVGLGLAMVGAARTHLQLGENDRVVVPVVLLLVLVFVATARFGSHSL